MGALFQGSRHSLSENFSSLIEFDLTAKPRLDSDED